MRRNAMFLVVSIWCFAPVLATAQTPPQKTNDPLAEVKPDTGKKDPAKKADTLEQLIAEALKNNPDIRVAETKLRAAEAETARARLKLISEITNLHIDIDAAQAGVEEGKERFHRAENLYRQKVISKEDFMAAESTYVKLKTELASLQAKLPYLLGRQNAKVGKWIDQRLDANDRIAHFDLIADKEALLAARINARNATLWLDKAHETPFTEKLRKALDTTARMDIDTVAPDVALDYLRDKALPGINLIVRAKVKKDTITIKLKEPVPVGAMLQYLEDELGVAFVLRDYGVVVVSADERMPPGAIRVVDFWKQSASSSKK